MSDKQQQRQQQPVCEITAVSSHGDNDEMDASDVELLYNNINARNRRKTCTRDRLIYGVVGCCAFAFVVAMVALFVPIGIAGANGNGAAAATDDGDGDSFWQQHAERLRNYSDAKTSPCDDFYQHVCGGWLATTTLADGQSSVGQFDAIADQIDAELLQVAEQGWPFVGTWWTACMDVEARTAHGTQELQPLLEIATNVASSEQLATALAALHSVGVNALFSMGVVPDERDPTRPAVELFYPMMGAPRTVWEDNTTQGGAQRDALFTLVATLLNAEDTAREALAFEREWLATSQMLPAQLRGLATQWLDVDALPARSFDWDTYWAHTLGAPPTSGQVGTVDPGFISAAVDDALRATTWHGIRSYLQYAVVMTFVDAMPNASALVGPLRQARSGAGAPSLEQECLGSVAEAFPELLGHYYVRRYFPQTSKEAAQRLLNTVLAAMGERLAANQWMDATTRTHALSKLAAIQPVVGYPDTWSPALPPFDVTTDNHMWNVIDHQMANVAGNWGAASLTALPAAPAWEMPVFQVNAYYDPLENDIVFPAGILQGGFFNEAAPLAANYGGIGMVVGHEVSHAFDDEGRHYDADGSRHDWWTSAASAEFEARAQCVVDLYSSFQTPYGPVNGALTEGENLADFGGLVVAYRAYHDALDAPSTWTNHSRFASRADYENHVRAVYGYSADQLFFRSWGASWCTERAPQRAAQLLHQDPHSPPRWRINGPASQSSDFATAFGCPAPPADACTMW